MQVVWVRYLVRKLRSHRPLTPKSQNIKQKQYCNKFDKDFEKLVYIRKILKKNKVKVKSLSHVRLFCDPMDCSLLGSSIHGIFQARVLE